MASGRCDIQGRDKDEKMEVQESAGFDVLLVTGRPVPNDIQDRPAMS
jgi:hypothetical protein